MTALAPRLIAPPAALPVTLAEAKARLDIEFDQKDATMDLMLRAAVKHFDGPFGAANQALVTQTWEDAFPMFYNGYMRLRVGPVASVTSVTYEQSDGVDAIVPASAYSLLEDYRGYIVSLNPGHFWPGAGLRRDAVRIRYVAGKAANEVDETIKHAILLMFGDMVRQKETFAIGVSAQEVPSSATIDRLLSSYRTNFVS